MGNGDLRIGIVGAGKIARGRHLPGFRAIPGVKVVAVCNLRRESAIRVAHEFDIPRVHESWEHLVDDPEVDAVVIGTWPYLHCPITLAALDAGKHVLSQARMAMNAREANRMLARARECPTLTTMVVPSPYGLTGDAYMQRLVADGFLGTLREVHVRGLNDALADPATPLGWRQIARYSGFNMLALGILHETAARWTPPVVRVLAHAAKLIPERTDPETGARVRVGTPDSVRAMTVQQDGSVGVYVLSGVILHDAGMSVSLFGSSGTIVYDLARDVIHAARAGEPDLKPLPIPDELRGGWRVEAEFVAAIRGEGSVTRNDFATAARSMHFTEAVARSSRHQHPFDLPLREFSNPSL
jgi:predicted dehydrogenase